MEADLGTELDLRAAVDTPASAVGGILEEELAVVAVDIAVAVAKS